MWLQVGAVKKKQDRVRNILGEVMLGVGPEGGERDRQESSWKTTLRRGNSKVKERGAFQE